MAKELGLKNKSTYQNWEYTTEPDMETLKKIAKILGVPAYMLLQGVIDFKEEEIFAVNEEHSNYGEKPAPVEMPADLLTQIEEHANKILLSLQELRQAPGDAFQRGTNVVPGSVQKASTLDKRKKSKKLKDS